MNLLARYCRGLEPNVHPDHDRVAHVYSSSRSLSLGVRSAATQVMTDSPKFGIVMFAGW